MTTAEKLKKIYSSPRIYIENFMKIVNKQSKLVPFILNKQQRILVKEMDKYNIILKSRQLGMSAVSCALSLYYAMTSPNNHCLLISYSLDSADAIFDKLKQLYDDLPNAIRLKDIANNRKELKFENGSKITVCTLGSKQIARGSSIKFCHISEVGFCKQDMVEKQILAIEQALLPNGKIILESTANGLNEFSNMWEKAENGDSLYKPFFFSWIEDKVMFANEYKDFTERYKNLNGKNLTYADLTKEEITYYEMGASIEQLTWRRIKIKNSNEMQFKQEFPASPIEAFVTSGNNIFNAEKLQKQYNIVKQFEPLKSIQNCPIELKPYIRNYLSVWETPQLNLKYSIGVDASEGVGADYSVVAIYKFDGMQVAEFRSNKTQPHEVAKICNALGIWYNRALLVVEKASGGHIILDRLRNTNKYKNLYKHKDYDQRGRMVKKIGFNTNPKTKPIMINDMVELWENDDIYIKSLNLLNEMKVYQFTDGKMNATIGKHDDTVIATALAIQGIKSGVNYKW